MFCDKNTVKSMHIAWLGKKSPFCGNVTYSREITNALLDRKHQVSFIHFDTDIKHNDSLSNLETVTKQAQNITLPFLYKSTNYTIPSFRSIKILANTLRSVQPDIVHASLAISPIDFWLPKICSELNLPLVATFHQPFDIRQLNFTSRSQQLTYQIYAPFLADYNQIIVFSHIQKEILGKLSVPRDRISVIPNGIDPSRYSPGVSTVKKDLNAKFLFLYQGRIAPEKNVAALLKAWHCLKVPEGVKLAIVGTGSQLKNLKAVYGSDSSIVWMGYIADEMTRINILRGTDVFILPSLVEGLSLSLLEAMSCGVACIATDVGADGEVIENGAGVILDSHRVTSQLCALIRLFVEQPQLSKEIGINGRERILDRYTLGQNIDRLEALYDRNTNQKYS
jgi:glycosyltransferase involved in cell wall biosynthesis